MDLAPFGNKLFIYKKYDIKQNVLYVEQNNLIWKTVLEITVVAPRSMGSEPTFPGNRVSPYTVR